MITLDLIDSAFHSIEIKTAAGQALAIDGSGFLTISNTSFEVTDGGGSLTVDATSLDIRGLNVATDGDHVYLTDSTGANALDIDASGFLTVKGSGDFNVTATQAGFSSWLVSTESVGATESELVSTPLSGRTSVLIQNVSSNDIYLKDATGVTTSNGVRLPKGSSFAADLNSVSNIFAIAGSGTNDIRVVEYAA